MALLCNCHYSGMVLAINYFALETTEGDAVARLPACSSYLMFFFSQASISRTEL